MEDDEEYMDLYHSIVFIAELNLCSGSCLLKTFCDGIRYKGTDPNKYDHFVLRYALSQRSPDIVEALLDHPSYNGVCSLNRRDLLIAADSQSTSHAKAYKVLERLD